MNLELNNYRGQDFGQATISSLDVAEMVGREHKHVLRDIRNIERHLTESKIGLSEYFLESTYKDSTGRSLPKLLLTKKGCELYATRMTGAQGTAFAVSYIERFNEMEEELQPKLPTSYKDALLALVAQVEKNEELEKTVAIQAPKVLFADSVSASKDSILVGQLAKLIKQNGYDIGQNRLFEWMREEGYLGKKGQYYNKPSQRSMDSGLFEFSERTHTGSDGIVKVTFTPKVTGKGQIYFINKFLSYNDVN